MENKIFASWTKSLTSDLSNTAYKDKNIQQRNYHNKYVLFEDIYNDNPSAVELPTIKQKFQRISAPQQQSRQEVRQQILKTTKNLPKINLSQISKLQHDFDSLKKTSRNLSRSQSSQNDIKLTRFLFNSHIQ